MAVMKPLLVAANEGLAVLVIRHDRKSGGDVGDSARGSSAFAGAVDIILRLQRVPGEGKAHERDRLLEGLSRFEETPDRHLIRLSMTQPFSYTLLGDPEEVREQWLRIELMRTLPLLADDALTTNDLIEILQVRDIDLRRALRSLLAEHLIHRRGAGTKSSPYAFWQATLATDD